jgi:hypothetical protein
MTIDGERLLVAVIIKEPNLLIVTAYYIEEEK